MTRAPGAHTVERALDIAAPAEWLFDLTQDYARRLDWDPFLVEATLRGGSTAGVGVRAWCVSKFPRWGMETEYVTFTRPTVVAIQMTSGPRVLKRFAGSWRFTARSPVLTTVTFRYRFETSPALVAPIAARMFTWDIGKRLAGLRDYATRHAPRRA